MEKIEVILKQYDNLISLVSLHHQRWNDFLKTYLTILSILIVGITTFVKLLDTNALCIQYKLTIIFFCVMGCLVSILAFLSMYRVRKDTNYIFFQLKNHEKIISKFTFNGNTEIKIPQIYTLGYKLFHEDDDEDLKNADKIPKILKVFRQILLIGFILSLFFIYFVFIIIYFI